MKHCNILTFFILLFELIATLNTAAIAQNKQDKFIIINGENKTTIPFQLYLNRIYFLVKVNGHKLHFILDTGSFNVLDRTAAKSLRIEAKINDEGGGFGKVRIKNVLLGGKVRMHNQVFYTVPLPEASTIETTDGTVGYKLLKHFVVRIDYDRHKMTLIRPAAFDSSHAGTAIPIFFTHLHPTIKGSIDGLSGHFWIDTGASGSLYLVSSFVRKHKLVSRYNATPPISTGENGAVGGAVVGRVARGGQLAIGNVIIHNPIIALLATKSVFPIRGIAGNIGGRILKRFTVTFDYGDHLMYLKPNKNYGKPMRAGRSGMNLKQTTKGFVIQSVMAGSPADEAGLKAKEIITAVNNKPANKISIRTLSKMMKSKPGTRIILTIGAGKKVHDVTITLRRLIPKTGGLTMGKGSKRK